LPPLTEFPDQRGQAPLPDLFYLTCSIFFEVLFLCLLFLFAGWFKLMPWLSWR
jgi:hypothetical protein